VIEMFGMFSPLMEVFARLVGNRVIRRVVVGVALVAVLVAVFCIANGFASAGQTMPLAGPGMAWG
jgi:phage-related protein